MVCHPDKIPHYLLIHIAILFFAETGQFENTMQDERNRTRSVPVRHWLHPKRACKSVFPRRLAVCYDVVRPAIRVTLYRPDLPSEFNDAHPDDR